METVTSYQEHHGERACKACIDSNFFLVTGVWAGGKGGRHAERNSLIVRVVGVT